jgi:transcription termination factor NusB
MRNEMEDDFKRELLRAVDVCINRYRYRPSYFLQMLDNYGAVGTAIKLVTADKFHEGFTKLWEFGRLDLTVEAIMRRSPYRQLFTKEVLDKALERLTSLGYKE